MSESELRQRFNRMMKEFHPIAVENHMLPGTPDVNTTIGWFELKWSRAYPKNLENRIPVEHYTEKQKRWGKKRWDAGGVSLLLLQVQQDYYLFLPYTAADYVGQANKKVLTEKCWWCCFGGMQEVEFKRCVLTLAISRSMSHWFSLQESVGLSIGEGSVKRKRQLLRS